MLLLAVVFGRTLMHNGWTTVISSIGVGGVNTVNYLYRTWGRIAPACTMDLYSLDKFKKYKNDWNYPVQVRYQEHVVPEKEKPRVTFGSAMKVTLAVGQCFGLNPVQGIFENDASKLREMSGYLYENFWEGFSLYSFFWKNLTLCKWDCELDYDPLISPKEGFVWKAYEIKVVHFFMFIFAFSSFLVFSQELEANMCRFKFISWRCLYTYLSMLGQFTMAFVLFLSLFKESSSTVDTATALIFYSFGFITSSLFLRIATKWPKLCLHIDKVESVDPNTDMKLAKKFNIACIVILSMALMEHCFSEFAGISVTLDCDPDSPLYESFMRRSFAWLFLVFTYNDYIGFLAHFSNFQCTFNWNFTDVFVICMSMYLTSRFNQVNQRIIAAKDKNSPSSFWRTMREDYNRSVHLVREVDKIIGGVVFISFASNLFFVCSQLLHTLAGGIKATPRCRPDSTPDKRFFGGYEHSIYFVYSFAFLVVRSLAVSLTAAKVHAASLEPAHSLYDVSSTNYSVEVERFLDQIHGDTVGLTGLQFFHVKRGLVLTIAGTIVTYELVLMQFTGVTPAADPE